jgi:hypothetical protein
MTANDVKFDYRSLLPGLAGGVARTMVVYPFDTVKTNLQNNMTGSTISTFTDIFRKNWRTFYRGSLSSFIVIPIERSIQYSVLERYKDRYGNYLVSASICAVTPLFSMPVQYISRNAMVSNKYNGVIDLIKTDGLKRCWSGVHLECLRGSLGGCLTMGIYASLRDRIDKKYHSRYGGLFGAVSAWAAWTVLFPIDTMVTAMVINRRNRKDTSFTDLLKERWGSRGIRGMYIGITPVYIRSILSNAAYTTVYEAVKSKL